MTRIHDMLQNICAAIVVVLVLVLGYRLGDQYLDQIRGPKRLCTWVKTPQFENARCGSPTNDIYQFEMPGQDGGTVSVSFNTLTDELHITLEPPGVYPPAAEEES